METIRKSKWHDPFVVFFCSLVIFPIMIYGMIIGLIKDWRRGPQEKSTSMGEMTDAEIEDLRIKYERMFDK